jgi:16S rRNA pseudouridine516 synthase
MRRLDQLLSNLGYGSRREVSDWVKQGRITVSGRVAKDSGARVEPSSVLVDGEALDHPAEILLVMNKPAGRVCSHEASEGPNVYGLLPSRWQHRNPPITSIGRLDKDTTGLLLLTDRSELVHKLTSPKHKVAKVYRALLDRKPPPGIEEDFRNGCRLPGEETPCAPASLLLLGKRVAEVTLTEGRYHQVKRMFAVHGCSVLELERTAFGPLRLDSLLPGQWRELSLDALCPL